MNDDQLALENFSGRVRLFPLPNLVLYPHVVQPLHIFEPRYREMTADALVDDRLLATALLQPGWEEAYDDKPPVHSVVCLGRIVADQLLPDGRYNLLLRGLHRAKILDELTSDKLYRVARAELIQELPPSTIEVAKHLRTALAEIVRARFTMKGTTKEQMDELFHGELPLGALCDILSFALPLKLDAKQQLLEEGDVKSRALRLILAIEELQTADPPAKRPGRKFPPDFSLN